MNRASLVFIVVSKQESRKTHITHVGSDPYENIYTVVQGCKYFTLFPPTEGWCLQGQRLFYCIAAVPRLSCFRASVSTRTIRETGVGSSYNSTFRLVYPFNSMVIDTESGCWSRAAPGSKTDQYNRSSRGDTLSPCRLVALRSSGGTDDRPELVV